MELTNESCLQADLFLLNEARAGDQEALGKLIERHYSACLRLAKGILRDTADAQDAVQDATWKALTRLDQYRATAPFVNWLLRIVTNQCLMVLRNRKRVQWVYFHAQDEPDEKRLPLQLRAAGADPETETLDRERHNIFHKELRGLPASFRTVMVLRDVKELPMTDIAESLRVNVGTAKSRLLRARLELGERVAARYGESAAR